MRKGAVIKSQQQLINNNKDDDKNIHNQKGCNEKEKEVNYNFGKFIADSVDLAILVGKEQTKPIQNGIKDAKFDKDKLIVVNDVKEAISIAQTYFNGKETYILLENDLPDLFNEK